MPDLLYFNPDPQIPDADLLGYGDLVYSNGVTNYLSGDPEMAAGLPRPPPGVKPKGSIDMGPPAPPAAPPLQGADGQQYQVDLMDPENPLKPATGLTGALNSLGNTLTGGIPTGQQGNGLGDMLGNAASRVGSAL